MKNRRKKLWIAVGVALSMLMSGIPVAAQANHEENTGFEAVDPGMSESGSEAYFEEEPGESGEFEAVPLGDEPQEEEKEAQWSTDGGGSWVTGTLADAVTAANQPGQKIEIQLLKNVTLTDSWNGKTTALGNGNEVTLDGNGYTISRGECKTIFFDVNVSNTHVTLKNIILDGGAEWNSENPFDRTSVTGAVTGDASLISVGNRSANDVKVTLDEGAVLESNVLVISTGAGVEVQENGTLEMLEGSAIQKNGMDPDNSALASGGGVVVNGGTLWMKGGRISENFADLHGGAVHIESGGAMVMEGGSISQNVAWESGGGISAFSDSQIALYGGEITDNRAKGGGGIRTSSKVTVGGSIFVFRNRILNSSTSSDIIFDDNQNLILEKPFQYGAHIPAAKEGGASPGDAVLEAGSGVTDADITDALAFVYLEDSGNLWLKQFGNTLIFSDGDPRYTVIFRSNGGTEVPTQTDIAPVSFLEKPEDPKKAGYTFAGWFTDPEFETPWAFETAVVAANYILYAKWNRTYIPSYYQVTFDSQGGTPVEGYSSVREYTTIQEPAATTYDGYTFQGWYRDPAGETPWDFTKDTVNGNLTLYAKWEALTLPGDMDVKLVSKTTDTVTLSWDAADHAEGYSLWYKAKGQEKYRLARLIRGTDTLQWTVTDLEPGTIYYFRGKAWRQFGTKRAYGGSVRAIRATTYPETAVIKSVTADRRGRLKVRLEKAAAGAERYAFCYSKKESFKPYRIGIRTSYTVRTIPDELPPGTYWVKARSYRMLDGKCYYGGWSEAVEMKAADFPPSSMSGFRQNDFLSQTSIRAARGLPGDNKGAAFPIKDHFNILNDAVSPWFHSKLGVRSAILPLEGNTWCSSKVINTTQYTLSDIKIKYSMDPRTYSDKVSFVLEENGNNPSRADVEYQTMKGELDTEHLNIDKRDLTVEEGDAVISMTVVFDHLGITDEYGADLLKIYSTNRDRNSGKAICRAQIISAKCEELTDAGIDLGSDAMPYLGKDEEKSGEAYLDVTSSLEPISYLSESVLNKGDTVSVTFNAGGSLGALVKNPVYYLIMPKGFILKAFTPMKGYEDAAYTLRQKQLDDGSRLIILKYADGVVRKEINSFHKMDFLLGPAVDTLSAYDTELPSGYYVENGHELFSDMVIPYLDQHDYNENGKTDDYLAQASHIDSARINAVYSLGAQGLLQSDAAVGENSEQPFEFASEGSYKLHIHNGMREGEEPESPELLIHLPRKGTETGNVGELSRFDGILTGPVQSEGDIWEGASVEYSLDGGLRFATGVTDYTQVTDLRIRAAAGKKFEGKADAVISIPIRAQFPGDLTSGAKAYISASLSYSNASGGKEQVTVPSAVMVAKPVDLTGNIFQDYDGDGARGPGETIPGKSYAVSLYQGGSVGGTLLCRTESDQATGKYAVSMLLPGIYTLKVSKDEDEFYESNSLFNENGCYTFTLGAKPAPQLTEVDLGIISGRTIRTNFSSVTILISETRQIIPTIVPDLAANEQIRFVSEDPSVATVDENGVIRYVRSGETKISVIVPQTAKMKEYGQSESVSADIAVICRRDECHLVPSLYFAADAQASPEEAITELNQSYRPGSNTTEIYCLFHDQGYCKDNTHASKGILMEIESTTCDSAQITDQYDDVAYSRCEITWSGAGDIALKAVDGRGHTQTMEPVKCTIHIQSKQGYMPGYYQVTFDSQGGTPVEGYSSVREYTTIQEPGAPTYDGYTFLGWYRDPAGETPWDFTKDIVNGNLTLYAKWETLPLPGDMDLKLVQKTTDTVTLSWDPVENAEGYSLWYKAKGQEKYRLARLIRGTDTLQWTVTDLEPGTIYYFRGKAWRQFGTKRAYGGSVRAIRATTYPETAVIESVTADRRGRLKVRLEQAAAGAERYAFCYSKKASFVPYKIGIRTSYTVRTMPDELSPGTYWVKARSYRMLDGKCYYGGWSEAVEATVTRK